MDLLYTHDYYIIYTAGKPLAGNWVVKVLMVIYWYNTFRIIKLKCVHPLFRTFQRKKLFAKKICAKMFLNTSI
jgi:hypothetical protein